MSDELSPGLPSVPERWILANQCEIMGKLFPDDADRLDQVAKALRLGFVPLFAFELDRFSPELLTQYDADEIAETLAMFRDLQASRANLADDAGNISAFDLWFPGWNEPGFRRWTEYLLEERNDFPELEYAPGLDAARIKGMTRDVYKSMRPLWSTLIAQEFDPQRLTEAQIISVYEPLKLATLS